MEPIMSLRGEFIAWYNNEFKTDPLYRDMLDTVEASPWHREINVGIHTDMVTSEYISWADKNWSVQTLVGAVACAFHDTGKPRARVEKYKPERGTYNSFGGHEIISARLFEDYAVRNAQRLSELFGLERNIAEYYELVYRIGFVIEHHMPYEQPSEKVQNIATTAAHLFGIGGNVESIFQNHLTADTHGRIADDHENKIAKVDQWIYEFDKKMYVPFHSNALIGDERTLILPIGPSGCGKSTLFKTLSKSHELVHYSWDSLRLEWYDSDYAKAYQMSVDDPKFNARYTKVFKEHILTGKNVYVDNTNLSRKRRRPWIDDARKHGYNVIGYYMPNSINTVLARQKTRCDKDVPTSAVLNHYMTLQLPLYGEVDQIEIIIPNT